MFVFPDAGNDAKSRRQPLERVIEVIGCTHRGCTLTTGSSKTKNKGKGFRFSNKRKQIFTLVNNLERFRKNNTTTRTERKTEHQTSEYNGEFDPGSGRTLAACLTHASRGVAILLAHG